MATIVVIQRKNSQPLPFDITEADLKARAERHARTRARAKRDAPQALSEYRDAEEAVRLRTEKLRTGRLARDRALRDTGSTMRTASSKPEK